MSTPQTAAASILALDDSPEDLFFLKRLLSDAGVKLPVLAFSSAHEAIKFLSDAIRGQDPSHVPSFVFTDINMPEMNGLEFAAWIKSQQALQCLPVVVLSSSAEPKDLARCRELGVHRHYVKFPAPGEIARLLQETGQPRRGGGHSGS